MHFDKYLNMTRMRVAGRGAVGTAVFLNMMLCVPYVSQDHSAFAVRRMTFPVVTQYPIPEHCDLYVVTGFLLSLQGGRL